MAKSKLEKQQEASERLKTREKRNPQDQLAILDKKFGKDQGASKERERLKKAIEENLNKKTEKKEKKDKSKKE